MAVYSNQVSTINNITDTPFYRDVLRGLTSSPKFLQSKYFYDAEGDKLFQQIMASPEYYPTRCEMEIFSQQTGQLTHAFASRQKRFDVVELGAGDAIKSTHLLRSLKAMGFDLTYYPVDISSNVIQLLEKEMPQRIEGLKVKGLNGDYFDMIRKSYQVSHRRKIVLFLGGNIGNFQPHDAVRFLNSLHQNLLSGDLVLIGFDLKKNPKTILAAYNDAAGITKAFNLNLLKRINRELGANFNIDSFDHYPVYNPVTGACKSFLISLERQEVTINDAETIQFGQYEPIDMELSQKYSVQGTDDLAIRTGFRPVDKFFDSKRWFLDALWEVI